MAYKPLQEEDDVIQGPDPTAPTLQAVVYGTEEAQLQLLVDEEHEHGRRTFAFQLEESTSGIVHQKERKRFKYARRILGVGVFILLIGFLAAAVALIAVSPSCHSETEETVTELTWWQKTVIYQCYPRSFQDSDGDGNGDLNGIASHIDYFVDIGVDTIWLNPIFSSPQKDNGYDISNYTDVDPLYGTLNDLRLLLQRFHEKGLHIILDLVPNHTSDQHPWFINSSSSRNSPKRDWYVWANSSKDGGPPNNWISVFGGSAWEWDPATDQYYLHQFSVFQPDLNYHNPEVVTAMELVLKFWLDFGIDGFRIDAVKHLLEDPGLHDEVRDPNFTGNCSVNISDPNCYNSLIHNLTTDYQGIHDIIRGWRKILDSFSTPAQERFMVGEVYDPIETVMLYYGENADEFNFPFNFFLLGNTNWTGVNVGQIVATWLDHMPKGSWPNWVLGNHDNPRIASKVGLYLARALNILLLTLPGTPTTYYGEEILMTDVYVPPPERHDPYGGRDMERTPMQWNTSANAGFTSNSTAWLPVPDNYTAYNVEVESANDTSMLSLYKKVTELRSNHTALQYTGYELVNSTTEIYAYRRHHESSTDEFIILMNLSEMPTTTALTGVALSDPEIVLSSSLNRTGTVDLESIYLCGGEALVIQGTRNDNNSCN